MVGSSRVSVVIPCFNAERYLEATIRSVFAQEWSDLEIIVVDDGSSDHSVELVQDCFPTVSLLRQSNSGVAAARNHGIESATGDWVAFLDADDIWLPGKLASQWEQVIANPDVRMNYTAWHVWSSLEPAPSLELIAGLQSADIQVDGPSGWIYPALLLDCAVWTSTVLMQRSIFDEIGKFDTSLRIGEDYDLWLRASRVTKILRVPRQLALYRAHPGSITRSAPSKNYQGIVIQRALDRWALESPDGTSADPLEVNRVLARTWSDFAGASLASGRLQQALDGGLQSVRMRWLQLEGWKILAKAYAQHLWPGSRSRRG